VLADISAASGGKIKHIIFVFNMCHSTRTISGSQRYTGSSVVYRSQKIMVSLYYSQPPQIPHGEPIL